MKRSLLLISYLLFFAFNLIAQQKELKELNPFVNIEKGLFVEAVDSLTQLLLFDKNSNYITARIQALIQLNELDKAMNDCQLLEQFDKGNAAIYKTNIYLLQNEIERAEKALLDNLKSAGKISLFQLLTNTEYRKIQDSDFIDSIMKTNIYSSTEKQIYKVEKYINTGNYNEAFFLANEIISRNSNIAYAYYLLSKINLHNSEFKSSKMNIDKAIFLKSSDVNFYLQRIVVSKKLSEYSEVLSDVNKLLRLNPYNTEFYFLKAEALLNNSDFDKAIIQADFYLALYPKNADALFIKANSYFKKGENFDALKCINESLESKKSVKQYELRGDIYMKTKTHNFAEMDYSMALDLDARNGDIWAKKGFARYQSGNKTGACADWEKGKRYGSIMAIEYLEKYCK